MDFYKDLTKNLLVLNTETIARHEDGDIYMVRFHCNYFGEYAVADITADDVEQDHPLITCVEPSELWDAFLKQMEEVHWKVLCEMFKEHVKHEADTEKKDIEGSDPLAGIPQHYRDLVGKKQFLRGGIFSGKREEPVGEYDVLDIRWGSAHTINMKEFEKQGPKKTTCHPTFELLIKREGMKKARWTRGFSIKEISIVNGKVVKKDRVLEKKGPREEE
ncbi:MAG: hypothetical protein ACYC1Q_07735 [Bacteroidia bacterium]